MRQFKIVGRVDAEGLIRIVEYLYEVMSSEEPLQPGQQIDVFIEMK